MVYSAVQWRKGGLQAAAGRGRLRSRQDGPGHVGRSQSRRSPLLALLSKRGSPGLLQHQRSTGPDLSDPVPSFRPVDVSVCMSLRVGFIGAGQMATALARGFIGGKAVQRAEHIVASCPRSDQHLLDHVAKLGCRTTHCNKTLVEDSDVVLLAVKPHVVPHVLDEVGDVVAERNSLIVSMAAGVTLNNLQQHLATTSRVIRVMPNTPCIVSEGATVYALGQAATGKDGQIIESLFSTVGTCELVTERMIDALTGVSGSGPAYMYIIVEAMADGGVKMGLPRDLACRLAAQTMVGAGKMILNTHEHPAVLKDNVCSPGGTTITALDILEKRGIRTAMIEAVEAATEKCFQLRQ